MREQYLQMVRGVERSYELTKTRRISDETHRFFGGHPDYYGIPETTSESGGTGNAVFAYCCPDSRYYKNPALLRDIDESCDYILRLTNDDCTSNLLITDYRAPATFDLIGIVHAYRVFLKYANQTEAEKRTEAMILSVIEKHAKGMLVTGFRTPNHRWVESAALLMTHNILGWPELAAKARKYLAEGIDIDEYGEFTERSPGMYNAVNDNALMVIAEEGNCPELYRHVEKNMDLLFDYIECDGSIFTQNSRRKDKGEGSASGKFYPGHPYYFLYLWAGLVLKNKRYLKFAREIFEDSVQNGRGAPGALWLFLLQPELIGFDMEKETAGTEISKTYSAYYPLSNIYRRRKDFFSYSIIANNPNFLFIKCGDLSVYVRACASFFMKAQFVADRVEKTAEGCRMSIEVKDDYKLPLETPPETSDYRAMDHSRRKHVCECVLRIIIDFIDTETGLKMKVRTESTENRIPFKLEYVVAPNCRVETDNLIMDAHAGEYITLKDGNVRLEHMEKGHVMTIKGMFYEHLYHTVMRGSVPKAGDAFTVYSTAFTPVDAEVEFVCGRREATFTRKDPV